MKYFFVVLFLFFASIANAYEEPLFEGNPNHLKVHRFFSTPEEAIDACIEFVVLRGYPNSGSGLDAYYGCRPEPSIYKKSTGLCDERCSIGSDPEICTLLALQSSCITVMAHSISLVDSQQRLHESVYQSSYPSILSISYHNNNRANTRFTPYSYRSQFTAGANVVRFKEPMYKPFANPEQYADFELYDKDEDIISSLVSSFYRW
jgi:hypothetical protein